MLLMCAALMLLLPAATLAASPSADDLHTSCTLSMTSLETSTDYISSIMGAFPLVLVAHNSSVVSHSVAYFFNDEPYSDRRPANLSASYLTFAPSPALLTLSFGPDTPCATRNCSLSIQATVSSLILPTLAEDTLAPAYSGLLFTDIPALTIHSSSFSVLKNETTAFVNLTDSESSPFSFLFNDIYNGNLTAATVMVQSTRPGTQLTVSNSSFSFSGSPVTASDYDSYYGGPRSFPDVQLSALALLNAAGGAFASVDLLDSAFAGHVASRGAALFLPSCAVPRRGRYYPAGSAQVRISNCAFDSNQAYFQGGAVYLGTQCNATLTNLTFMDNSLVDHYPYYHRVMRDYEYRGGAVYVHNPVALTVTHCTFLNNSANVLPWNGVQGIGGGLHVSVNHTYTPDSQTENIPNPVIQIGPAVTFSGNNAYTGGALSYEEVTYNIWWEGEFKMDVSDTLFSGNSAETAGGAVYLKGPSVYANENSYSAHVTATRCVFADNVAKQDDGGAVHAEQLDSLFLYESAFSNNSAPLGDGGAVAASLVGQLSFGKSALQDNSARSAGAVSMQRCWLLVYLSNFTVNEATAGTGGAIKAVPSSFFIEKSLFAGNVAAVSGGAVSAEQQGTSSSQGLYQAMYPESFSEVEARFTESAQGLEDFSALSRDQWIPTSIAASSSVYFPKVEVLSDLVGYVSASTFVNNIAYGVGGALSASGAALVIDGSEFLTNVARSGGALFLADCVGAVNLYNVSFLTNGAEGLGGAVAASSCNTTFNSTAFSGNEARGGGAVYAAPGLAASDLSAALVTELNTCNVTKNKASELSGGGLLALGANVTLRGGAWTDNRAAMLGGALLVSEGGAVDRQGDYVMTGNIADNLPDASVYF